MKLTIDVGTEQRTLVAGISEAYEPETLVGRTIVIVFNLKPAKLMGIESNGMVLAASAEGGEADARRIRSGRAAGVTGAIAVRRQLSAISYQLSASGQTSRRFRRCHSIQELTAEN